ncbi:ParB/RepB/Spo0J family partition protein [Gemmata sp. G18]|uniref:ParB/RepB/Spo0J family partition protein n=1 Tax=Gemmata palustris TaxID=2822762 RepID=A0ABS5BPU0_9BACT|nr:ParB/RepB/Spo0J family partition protein [Gemmata palustris]MBP3955467.1 ParB/RepB/Spo0J family partition protein [Gemmata palustris]
MPKLENKPLSWLKPDPNQPRKSFIEAELRLLGESLRRKQLQPVLCQPDGTIIAGERRWRAATLVGLPTLEVKIADEVLTDSQKRVWQLVENMLRADLTGYEQWTACAELMCMNAGWQMKDAAEALGLDPSTITRILSPSKCVQEWQDALRDGKVGITDCYSASKLPQEKQAGLLALKLSGASRDHLEAVVKKARSTSASTVKLAKVRCPLSTGTVVTVQGAEMGLDELIEALQSTLESARRANKEQIDVKTWARVMADKAKVAV